VVVVVVVVVVEVLVVVVVLVLVEVVVLVLVEVVVLVLVEVVVLVLELVVNGGDGGKGLAAFKQFRPSLEEVVAEPLTRDAPILPVVAESKNVSFNKISMTPLVPSLYAQ